MEDIAPPPVEPQAPSQLPKQLPLIIGVLVLVLAGAALWFILTRPTSELPNGMGTSTSQGVSVNEKREVRDEGPYHEITASYPAATPLRASAGASADAKAVSVMKTFAEQEVARFKDNNVDALTAADIQMQGLGGDRKYVLEADYDVHESPVTVSYVYHMFADTMGAHPNAYYRTFVYDKASGEGIVIHDLFATPDYLEVLSNESRTRLRAQIAEASQISESELDTTMLDAGTTPFEDNFQNFYLEGNVLVIVFPPYQVGPWAIGTQEVRIPRASLGNALQTRYR